LILIGKFKKIRETSDVNQRCITALSLIFSLFLDISIPHYLLGPGYYCAVSRERERKADAFAGENCDEEGLKGLIDYFKRDRISLKLQKIITPEVQKCILEALLKTRWGWTHPADSERIANVQLQLQQRFPKTEEEILEQVKIQYEAFLKTINRDLAVDQEVEG
jgi:Zn-dependent protease with chaperone function